MLTSPLDWTSDLLGVWLSMPGSTFRTMCRTAVLAVAMVWGGAVGSLTAAASAAAPPLDSRVSLAPSGATVTPVSTPLPTPTREPAPTPTRPVPVPTNPPHPHPTKPPHPKQTKTPPYPTKTSRPGPTKIHPRPTKTPRPRPTAPHPHPTKTRSGAPKSPQPTARPHPTVRPKKTKSAKPVKPKVKRSQKGSPTKKSSGHSTKRHRHHPLAHPHRRGAETILDVENTISPIGCTSRPTPIRKPFLSAPYHGFVRLFSYFDHDYPDFAQDGTITIANGLTVDAPSHSVSRFAVASDFPAYWSPALRTYVYYDGHNGYDFGLVYQPVYAAAAGKVIFAGWNYPGLTTQGYGQMVMIDHGRGYVTLYGHFSKLQVHAGERVKSGQQIGISGNTGHSSGPHLHFTVFHDCKPTDPYGWTGSTTDPLTLYQGESSSYLWLKAPPVLDPYPHFPGLAAEPAPPGPEILNLALPPATTLPGLLSSLNRERAALAGAMLSHGIQARYDATAAAFVLPAGVRPALLYSLPFAASVTPDDPPDLYVSSASFADRIALLIDTVPPRSTVVGGSWHAFVFTYHGRSYLLGHGPANQNLEFLVQRSVAFNPMITVSNGGGAFAVPLASQIPRNRRFVLLTNGNRYVLKPPASRPPEFGRHRAHRSAALPSPPSSTPTGARPPGVGPSSTNLSSSLASSQRATSRKAARASLQAGWAMVPMFLLVTVILLVGWWLRPRNGGRSPTSDIR